MGQVCRESTRTHAKQFRRANRMRRDIARKIEGHDGLEVKFARLPSLARRVQQQPHQRGPKV